MPSKHDPADSLTDIIENAERIKQYLAGMDRDAFAVIMRPAARSVLSAVTPLSAARSAMGASDSFHVLT